MSPSCTSKPFVDKGQGPFKGERAEPMQVGSCPTLLYCFCSGALPSTCCCGLRSPPVFFFFWGVGLPLLESEMWAELTRGLFAIVSPCIWNPKSGSSSCPEFRSKAREWMEPPRPRRTRSPSPSAYVALVTWLPSWAAGLFVQNRRGRRSLRFSMTCGGVAGFSRPGLQGEGQPFAEVSYRRHFHQILRWPCHSFPFELASSGKMEIQVFLAEDESAFQQQYRQAMGCCTLNLDTLVEVGKAIRSA